MGFIIKYSRFFSVQMEKENGAGEPIGGFRFFPTEDCQILLDNYNLVFRAITSGFSVYYSETPMIPISERVRFSFGFHLPDSGFFSRYGLEKTGPADPTVYQAGLYFDNLDSGGAVITASPASLADDGPAVSATVDSSDTYRLYRQTFKVYDSAVGTVPNTYQLTNKLDPAITQSVTVNKDSGGDFITTTINSVDMEEDYIGQPGPYLLQADTDPPPDRNVYLNDELGKKSARGVIDIYWETAQNTVADPDTGQQYTITFKPK
ncbi:MAG: hypothetical protein R3281_00065 [Balneolaceae bacterium]|nr:hypothetical protein [Balneolaceae bacterium]